MMTQWLARWRTRRRPLLRKPVRNPSSVRLAVEQLESRYCPAPVISSFYAVAGGSGHTVNLTGAVSDSYPGGLVVTFSGCGISTSVSLPSSGTFNISATATSLGTVTAVAENTGTQVDGNPAYASISDAPPVINNFTASHYAGNMYTFSGQVTDDQSVAGMVVTLGGIPSLRGVTVTTNSQGWFTYTCQLGANESGTATAQTQDIWGVLSNVAWTRV